MQDFQVFIDFFRREWAVIRGAGTTFVIAIVLIIGVVFLGVQWLNSGRDNARIATIDLLKEQRDSLQKRLDAVTPTQISRRKTLAGLQACYANGSKIIDKFKRVNTEAQVEPFRSEATTWINECAAWIEQNMGPAARGRFLVYTDTWAGAKYFEVQTAIGNLQFLIENSSWDKALE